MVLASQQKWGEVLLGTSTSEFAPRSGELALLHWKALRHLGLDNVSVNLLPADDPTARDILEIRQYAARAGDVANIFTRQKYHRLADAGEVLAQLVLAEAYMVGGVDIPRSVSSAVGFYRKAAEKGNNFARVALAKINEEGIEGAPIDLAETIKWMTLAADDGSSAAQFNLGVYYDHGIGVPVDPIRALYWYKLASDQGNKDAPCNIGILFANGTIRKDAAEAARWYRLGADRNDEFAQYNLGRLYQLGLGVPLDLKEAYIWLRIAAVKGHAPAVEPAAVVKSTLRPEALVDAERSVRAWLSAHQ